jgi:hypothetical protein
VPHEIVQGDKGQAQAADAVNGREGGADPAPERKMARAGGTTEIR